MDWPPREALLREAGVRSKALEIWLWAGGWPWWASLVVLVGGGQGWGHRCAGALPGVTKTWL